MNRHLLNMKTPFIDPRWLRDIQGKEYETEVNPDGSVTLEGEKLEFINEQLPVGTKVIVYLGMRYFTCELVEERLAWKVKQEQLYQKHEEDRKEAHRHFPR